MSNSVVEELEFEKLMEDFLSEADQLEDSDLNYYKQTIEQLKEFSKKLGFEINDEIAIYCYVQGIAIGFVYRKYGIENYLSSDEFLSVFKPYLDYARSLEQIEFILKLNPLEFKEYLILNMKLLTKMFKKRSWIERSENNKDIYKSTFGNSMLINIIRIEGFIKHADIKPQDYFKFSTEPMMVSNFLYWSKLSEVTNVPEYKDYCSKIAKDELKEIQNLCNSKTKNLFHPDDARFENHKKDKKRNETKFIEDIKENKTEAEGIFNELIARKFSDKKLMDIIKYGLAPGKNLVSFSRKFEDELLNKIESYWISKGHSKEELREIRKKLKNVHKYSPDEQKEILKKYEKVFSNPEFSFSPTDSPDSDPYSSQRKDYTVNPHKERLEYVHKDPETTVELLYSNDKFNINEIVDEFILKQSPALKKVGLFLSDKFDDYINPNTGKFKIIEIQKDSKLPIRSVERFTKSFYEHIKEEYPELNPSN